MALLLAVDLGVRTGLAHYGDDGRLRDYRSQNFGSAGRLRRALPALLDSDAIAIVAAEGGGDIAQLWSREAARRGIEFIPVSAEIWRPVLLLPREQRDRGEAKRAADVLARRVIEWSGAARPTSLRHDAAEAILVGLWAVLQVGWLTELPRALRAS